MPHLQTANQLNNSYSAKKSLIASNPFVISVARKDIDRFSNTMTSRLHHVSYDR